MALDANLSVLLTTDVQWYGRSGVDKHGQETWNAPVTLKCYPTFGAVQVLRKDGSLYLSNQALYFDANDTHVQQFQLGDKFQAVGIGGGMQLEAVSIDASYSPGPSLNAPMTPWIVEVIL